DGDDELAKEEDIISDKTFEDLITEKNSSPQDDESYEIEDWYDYSNSDVEGHKSPESFEMHSSGHQDKSDYEVLTDVRMRETPLDQLHRAGLEEKYVIIGEEIIGSLDDDGYLRDSSEDVINDIKKHYGLEVSEQEFEHVLKIIQKFDPVAIASRNLQECLMVQLEELDIDSRTKDLCMKLINDHFEDFSLKRYEKISRSLGIGLEMVNELFDTIHKLNPVPGNLDNIPERNYVYPDFIVKKVDGEFLIELNDDFLPSLRINKKYLTLAKQKNTTIQTKEFIKSKFEAAKWFINSIISRNQTILKVMRAIVERQKKFFMSNGENLVPLYEKDIAFDINVDLSTVSRTVRNKYVQTDFGTFELKYFFSNPIHTESGEDVSSKIVKEKIKEFIGNEDKTNPLTDDKITQLMNKAGFPISRRTVAKYREAMKIPKA
ncbi:MAG: RNA polymerase factor sigma-54, partial [Ignavibacteria bacterium]